MEHSNEIVFSTVGLNNSLGVKLQLWHHSTKPFNAMLLKVGKFIDSNNNNYAPTLTHSWI